MVLNYNANPFGGLELQMGGGMQNNGQQTFIFFYAPTQIPSLATFGGTSHIKMKINQKTIPFMLESKINVKEFEQVLKDLEKNLTDSYHGVLKIYPARFLNCCCIMGFLLFFCTLGLSWIFFFICLCFCNLKSTGKISRAVEDLEENAQNFIDNVNERYREMGMKLSGQCQRMGTGTSLYVRYILTLEVLV